MVNRCKQMEQEYTWNNCTRNLFQTNLWSNSDELNILADTMKKNWASATQHVSSIFIATTKVLMQYVIPLLIYNFWDPNLREQEYRKFNRVLRMRVSGKNQDSAKQNNDWLCSTDFQRIKSKYISKLRKNIRQKQW